MPQDSLSSPIYSTLNPGPLRLECHDVTGLGPSVAIEFVASLVRMTRPEPRPIQHVNVALNGALHIFELSENEPLTWPINFMDIPYFDDTPPHKVTAGYKTLQSFVRWTLGYSISFCTITTPDGFLETMRYTGGLETFEEAASGSRSQRGQRWTGTLTFVRVLPAS